MLLASAVRLVAPDVLDTRRVWFGFQAVVLSVTLSPVAWRAALILATTALLGVSPFVEFVRDELPRLASGASFPQTELPGAPQANLSGYGLITKLRSLGLGFLDRSAGRGISSVYTLLLVVVALATGWRAGGIRPGRRASGCGWQRSG